MAAAAHTISPYFGTKTNDQQHGAAGAARATTPCTRSHWMWKTWREATGIKKKLAKEDASVLGAFDFYRDKPGSDDGSGDAVLAHQLKCILLLDQTGKQ